MARVIPAKTEAELAELRERSPGEERVYRACLALPDSWVVLYGLRTVTIKPSVGVRDGETDFVIIHPDYGILIVEVKSGNIVYKDGRWIRRLKNVDKPITDPFGQAVDQKHTLINLINRDIRKPIPNDSRVLYRHAVLLPDVRDVRPVTRLANVEPEIVGGGTAVDQLKVWVEKVFRFGSEQELWSPLNESGVAVVEDILAANFCTEPLLGFRLGEEEHQRIYLTSEQWKALTSLRSEEELAVAGGAGTGKTLLALRRAQDCARAGLRTLLLCFNSALADFLKSENLVLIKNRDVAEEHLQTASFHEFCYWVVNDYARPQTGKDYFKEARDDHPTADHMNIQWPHALALALEECPLQYDVVIVDEGQDFGSAYWFALREIWAEASRKYICYDSNQAIFRRSGGFPITPQRTWTLTKNCRNTRPIHNIAYRYYKGPPVEASPIQGTEILRWKVAGLDRQARRLVKETQKWIQREHVRPEDIAVLIMDSKDKERAFIAAERHFKGKVGVSREKHGLRGHVLLDTVARFKGLEAAIIVLWMNQSIVDDDIDTLLYVGLSRAKSILVLLGDDGDLRRIPDTDDELSES